VIRDEDANFILRSVEPRINMVKFMVHVCGMVRVMGIMFKFMVKFMVLVRVMVVFMVPVRAMVLFMVKVKFMER